VLHQCLGNPYQSQLQFLIAESEFFFQVSLSQEVECIKISLSILLASSFENLPKFVIAVNGVDFLSLCCQHELPV